MRIINDPKLDFDGVLIVPKRSSLKSRGDVDLNRQFTFRHSPHKFDGIPIISANMTGTGTIEMANALNQHKVSVALHKHYPVEELTKVFLASYRTQQYLWYSMGIGEADLNKFYQVKEQLNNYINSKLVPEPSKDHNPIHNVCIDVANGYSQYFVDFVKKFREDNPTITIMAGNVVTPEITEELILAGADIVKVGIGPGSVCTTRIKTGIGYPQLSAIIECADAAHGLEGQICGDGGCRTPGDVAKAFGGGADFVMLGGMLAGHDESGGKVVGGEYKFNYIETLDKMRDVASDGYKHAVKCKGETYIVSDSDFNLMKDGSAYSASIIATRHPWAVRMEGERFVEFYGMSSKVAQDKHNGGVAEYRASEGKRVLVPYRGPVIETLKEILGGVRSCCTYVGARKLKELSKRTTFITLQGDTHNQVFGDSTK
jgi:GMP reductase